MKTKFLGEIGVHSFISLLESPWLVGLLGGDFVNFRPKMWEILNFE
jgi:hypothetical protein